MSNYIETFNSIIPNIPLDDFRLILGVKISDNLYKTIIYYDSTNMNIDYSMNGMYFSVEDKFHINNFDTVLYDESINKHFFENKEDDYFAIGQNIIFRDETVGFIYVFMKKNTKYDDVKSLRELFYDQLKNFLILILDVKDSAYKDYFIEQTISTLFYLLKAHDAYTYYHSLRIADLSVLLAENLNLDQTKIEKVYYSALIHDLGEMWISKDILQKPDKLSPLETEEVKQHTKKLELLFAGNDFFSEFVEIAKYHHEYLDGSGYYGKKNYDISILSRILTVAEVTDALLSNRPWRKALNIEDAPKVLLKMVQDGKLDKTVVETVIKIIPEFYGGIIQPSLFRHSNAYAIFNIDNENISLEVKIINSRKDFINIFLPEKNIIVKNKIIDLQNTFFNFGNSIHLEYYLNNSLIKNDFTIVGKNKLGYILKKKEIKKGESSFSIKLSITGIGVPLKRVIFVNKYVWRLDNEKAFKASIESISKSNIIFYALKDKIEKIGDTKLVLTFDAMGTKIKLLGEIVHKEEIFKGYYHCDFKIGENTEEEMMKLLQLISMRKDQLKRL